MAGNAALIHSRIGRSDCESVAPDQAQRYLRMRSCQTTSVNRFAQVATLQQHRFVLAREGVSRSSSGSRDHCHSPWKTPWIRRFTRSSLMCVSPLQMHVVSRVHRQSTVTPHACCIQESEPRWVAILENFDTIQASCAGCQLAFERYCHMHGRVRSTQPSARHAYSTRLSTARRPPLGRLDVPRPVTRPLP